MLPASPLSQGQDEAETPPASERSRPTEPWRRPPPMRETQATIDEEGFDLHDTIPAPPWLDDTDADEEPLVPPR